jgi:glycosyltransferase involved in cell wall biosynthesis
MSENKPICVFQAPLWTRSGYGDWAMAVAKSLNKYDKFNLHLVPTRWGGCSRKHLSEDISNPEEKSLFGKILRQQLNKQPELYIQSSIPPEFQAVGKYNIGMTAAIETTVARGDWIEGLNRMNMNIVMSKHGKTVFENASYTKNNQGQAPTQLKSEKLIEILFWGIDTDVYKKTDVKLPSIEVEMAKIKEDFCYLFVGQWTSGDPFADRKDIGNLIRVFMETFKDMGDKPKPALIIKTSGAAICTMDKYDIINRLKMIKDQVRAAAGTGDLPNVYLIYGNLTSEEMNALYNHEKVKAHISFTHGEGFGMPLLEASLSGKPILASAWSGHVDFLNPNYCKLLEGELNQLPPASVNEWLIKESGWFTVNYAKAAETIKNVFYHYGGYIENAEKLRLENMEKFSTKKMDEKLHNMLDSYVPKFAVEQKIVLPKLKKIELPKLKKLEASISKSVA